MTHDHPAQNAASQPDMKLREQAELYLFGQLSQEERAEFERDLRGRKPGAEEALREAFRLSTALGVAAPAAAPPAGARARLMAKLAAEQAAAPAHGRQIWRDWSESAAPKKGHDAEYCFAGDGEYQQTGFPGVSVRKLFADGKGRAVTMLVRMDAGSTYPPHRHGGLEECYVLEGDLHVLEPEGEIVMHAGDYQHAEDGSKHPVQRTERGCLLLIRSSQHDELLGR